MRGFTIFILLHVVVLFNAQNKIVLQPVLEYKFHTNQVESYSFFANNLTWQVLPNNFISSNVVNYGLKVGYKSKYLGSYFGLIFDNNRLKNQLQIFDNKNLIASYTFDKTYRYLRITNHYDLFILGRDTVNNGKNLFSQLLFTIGGDLSIPIFTRLETDQKKIQSNNYDFNFENSYGNGLAKQIFISIGLTYKVINRKNNNLINLGINYRFTQRNFLGMNSNLKVVQTELNSVDKTYYFNWSASNSGLYLTISKDIGF